MLLLRALLAFLALPALVGFLAPLLLMAGDPWRREGTRLGWGLAGFGLVVLLGCVREFYVRGKGTLAPWDPPSDLVTSGLYRAVRNPMYIGVAGIVAGLGLAAGSPLVGLYAALLLGGFHLRVVLREEPELARKFPAEWRHYSRAVNRWRPRFRRSR